MKSSKPTPAATQVVTQTNDPWSGQQPFLETGFQKAEDLVLNKPPEFFPNSTVVPFSNQTSDALDLIENRARAGSPLTQIGQNTIQSAASGDMLKANPFLQQDNPYLSSAIDAASSGIKRNYESVVEPSIDARFSAGGRYGSGLQAQSQSLAQQNLADQLSDVATNMAFSDYGMQRQGYDTERGRQIQAAQLAPQMAQQDYVDAGQLMSVGQAEEGQAAAQLQEDMDRFNFNQNAEKQALADYMALVAGGQYGGTQTTSTPIYQDSTSNTIGNIASLAGAAGGLLGPFGAFGKGGFFG
tara:strand:- start:3898 stop:4791 length:894 start_codon:yes stop_codon:yes gene_type:complete